MPWGFAAAAAGTVVGALISSDASKSAAKTQAQAANRASDTTLQATRETNALQKEMFETTRADMAPWRAAGGKALSELETKLPAINRRFTLSDFEADPGYNFRLKEGEKAINRAAAARGMYGSGATMKALTRYNSDIASNEFGTAYNRYTMDNTNFFNRLAAVSGIGQTAAQQVGAAGQTYAANVGANTMTGVNASNNALLSGAAARASGYVGQANAFNNALSTGVNLYQNYQMMDYLKNGRQPQQPPAYTMDLDV